MTDFWDLVAKIGTAGGIRAMAVAVGIMVVFDSLGTFWSLKND